MTASVSEQHKPIGVQLHSRSRQLELEYAGGERYSLSCEFLRVYSPSAEVLGHGSGQEVLQTGKRDVTIAAVEPVGNYAILIRFSDGHDTGIYSWELLYRLGAQQDAIWQSYLERLEAAGVDRDTPMVAPGGHACGSH